MVVCKAAVEDVAELAEICRDFQQIMKGAPDAEKISPDSGRLPKGTMKDGSAVVWLTEELVKNCL